MKTTTATNHHFRLLSIVKSIFSQARAYCLSHDKILEKIKTEVYSDPAYKKAPQWVRSELSVEISSRFDSIFRNWVVWGFLFDGKVYLWDELSAEQKTKCMIDSKSPEYPGGHFWLKLEGNFFIEKDGGPESDKFVRRYVLTNSRYT